MSEFLNVHRTHEENMRSAIAAHSPHQLVSSFSNLTAAFARLDINAKNPFYYQRQGVGDDLLVALELLVRFCIDQARASGLDVSEDSETSGAESLRHFKMTIDTVVTGHAYSKGQRLCLDPVSGPTRFRQVYRGNCFCCIENLVHLTGFLMNTADSRLAPSGAPV